MTTVIPEGDTIRKAVKWVEEQLLENPNANRAKLAEQAALKFDLTPKDTLFLERFFRPSR